MSLDAWGDCDIDGYDDCDYGDAPLDDVDYEVADDFGNAPVGDDEVVGCPCESDPLYQHLDELGAVDGYPAYDESAYSDGYVDALDYYDDSVSYSFAVKAPRGTRISVKFNS